MPQLTVKLTPPPHWPDLEPRKNDVVFLQNDAVVEIAGLDDGTQEGKPTVAFRIDLPDGRVVIFETTWRLFAIAFHALAGKYGERPDLAGTAIEADLTGSGHRSRLEIVSDDPESRKFIGCEICGEQREADSFKGWMAGTDYDALPEEEKQFYEVVAEDGPGRAYGLNDIGRQRAMVQWLRRHFHEKHPSWTPPVQEPK